MLAWLHAGFHGSMGYMAAHSLKRVRPAELLPGTVRVITARMDCLQRGAEDGWSDREQAALQDPQRAVISVYARGRDYHEVLRPHAAQCGRAAGRRRQRRRNAPSPARPSSISRAAPGSGTAAAGLRPNRPLAKLRLPSDRPRPV